MADNIEIERKFLVDKSKWRPQGEKQLIKQGFLASSTRLICRIRQLNADYFLAVKAKLDDITRHEFEYQVPVEDGEIMLSQHCQQAPIEKTRYRLKFSGMIWEVDVFEKLNHGLIVAEIELESVDQKFTKPDWLGKEVSDQPRYFNSCLVNYPYCDWSEAERDG